LRLENDSLYPIDDVLQLDKERAALIAGIVW